MSPLMSYHPADRIRMFKFQNQSDGELSCFKAIPTSSTWTLFEYFVLKLLYVGIFKNLSGNPPRTAVNVLSLKQLTYVV